MLGDDFFDELYRGTAFHEQDHRNDPGYVSDFGQPLNISFTDTSSGIDYHYADTEAGRAQAVAKLSELNANYHSVDPNPLAASKLGVLEGTYGAVAPWAPQSPERVQLVDYDTSFGDPLYDSGGDEDDDYSREEDDDEREENYRFMQRVLLGKTEEDTDEADEPLPPMTSTRPDSSEDTAPLMESNRPF